MSQPGADVADVTLLKSQLKVAQESVKPPDPPLHSTSQGTWSMKHNVHFHHLHDILSVPQRFSEAQLAPCDSPRACSRVRQCTGS